MPSSGTGSTPLPNPRKHATTQRVVNSLPSSGRIRAATLGTVLNQFWKLSAGIAWEGMVSVGGNTYSVPDATMHQKNMSTLCRRSPYLREWHNDRRSSCAGKSQHARVQPDHRRSTTSQTGKGHATNPLCIKLAGDTVPQRLSPQ